MFAYIAGSPFVFITLHGVPPARYGLLFGANALGVLVGLLHNGTAGPMVGIIAGCTLGALLIFHRLGPPQVHQA